MFDTGSVECTVSYMMRKVAESDRATHRHRNLSVYGHGSRFKLGGAVFQIAWEEGRVMTEEQAIALALENEGDYGHRAEAKPA